MLRPATPLSVLFFIAFVLLLVSTISTPIIRAVPLASIGGVDFGVFGACSRTECTGVRVGYNPLTLLSASDDDDFTLPNSARQSLTAILVVHPVAALLALICFGLAVAAHFHGPAHSPRYLLALLILSFPTLLVSLLAFLVDILLFVPHLKWGGWIVLAATILIVASGVVTCAMRRTLVSRKARKKRIAENAEMNGANFYAAQSQAEQRPPPVEAYARADSPPPIADETKYAQYSSYDNGNNGLSKQTTPEERNGSFRSENDRRPLDPYAQPPMPARRPSRDQYSNPLPPSAVAAAEGLPPPGLRHQSSRGSLNSQGSGRSYGSQGSRGPPPGYVRGRGGPRGGYGGPPRGSYGPGRGGYGPPRGGYGGPPRGGYGGPPRGGMMPARGGPNGLRGPPPPGWNAPPGGRSSPGPGPNGPGYRGPGGPDNYYDGQPMAPQSRSNSRQGSLSRGPIGQAIEMDERPGGGADGSAYPLRDLGSDMPGRQNPTPNSKTPNSVSIYSDPMSSDQQPYVPARAHWATPQPLNNGVPRQGTPPVRGHTASPARAHARQGSDYYEDVDPRFADNGPPSPVPNALMPGAKDQRYPSPSQNLPPQILHPSIDTGVATGPGINNNSDPSFDDPLMTPDGARSPTGSEASHFTSVSQRGINPQWRPPPGQHLMPPPSRRPAQRDDIVLNANPDFSLPGIGGGGRGRGRGRGGGMAASSDRMNSARMLSDGRYPSAI